MICISFRVNRSLVYMICIAKMTLLGLEPYDLHNVY